MELDRGLLDDNSTWDIVKLWVQKGWRLPVDESSHAWLVEKFLQVRPVLLPRRAPVVCSTKVLVMDRGRRVELPKIFASEKQNDDVGTELVVLLQPVTDAPPSIHNYSLCWRHIVSRARRSSRLPATAKTRSPQDTLSTSIQSIGYALLTSASSHSLSPCTMRSLGTSGVGMQECAGARPPLIPIISSNLQSPNRPRRDTTAIDLRKSEAATIDTLG